MNKVTLAFAKGRIGNQGVNMFKGTPFEMLGEGDSRRLIYGDRAGIVTFIFVKPVDVVTYVEEGIADLGIVGRDTILEENKDVYELMDLKLAQCRFVVAGPKGYSLTESETIRVASKYPRYAEAVLQGRGKQVEVIELGGSVELAPLVGLSDVIIDIVETGETLAQNGLEVLEELDPLSGRLIANKSSYRFKHSLIQEIEEALGGRIYAQVLTGRH